MTNQDMTPGQIKYSRINEIDEKFDCESCGEFLNIEDKCDHDNLHNFCVQCCDMLGDNKQPIERDDLD
jgi:hypothetical protein